MPSDLLGLSVIPVVAVALMREHRVHGVMEVIAPHAVVAIASMLRLTHQLASF